MQCEEIWLKSNLSWLKIASEEPTKAHSDNQPTMSDTKHLVHHDRIKHVELDWHFIIDNIENKSVSLNYIPTTMQIVDILTKA